MNFSVAKNIIIPSLVGGSLLMGVVSCKEVPTEIPEPVTAPVPEKAPEEVVTEPVAKPENDKKELQVVKISENIYQLGKITLNKKTREIMIPATAEIVGEEIVEYLLVSSQGKIHESLLITDARPSNVNIAFKLLGYQEAKHLFRKVNKDFQPQEDYETATDEEKKKSKFHVKVSWKEKGEDKSYVVEELVLNPQNDEHLESTPWVYGGSFIYKGTYVADQNNDILAIFTDRTAVANYAGAGREDDTLWRPNSKLLPRHGTAVTITLTPHIEKNNTE